MANVIYDNFFLSNEAEDQYNSRLDLQQFCTVDNGLVGTAGMLRKINVYRASNGTEKLDMGEGNTETIEVNYASKEYRIQLAQNRFAYFDEEAMTDPFAIVTGVRHAGVDMFNTANADVMAEFQKATMVVPVSNFDFAAFADAQAMLNVEDLEGLSTFAFVNPTDVAELRKKLKDDLKYVEAFARQGYVGTVAGTNIHTSKIAPVGSIALATREAVTLFNKRGTEVEQVGADRRAAADANIRKNWIFTRKYYLAALTNETKAVKILKGTAALSVDTEVDTDKTYYEAKGLGYIAVEPEGTENPVTEGWYEITEA